MKGVVVLSMQSMSVNTAQVAVMAQQLRGGAQGIRASLDELEQKVSRLRSQWSGQSQMAYDQAQRQWNVSIAEMQQLLERIATSTENMADTYTSGDRGSAKHFPV